MSLPNRRASSPAAKENIAPCPSRSSAAANRPPAMVDARDRRADRHREPPGEPLEEPAITLAQPPVDPAVLVADVVFDRDAVELGAVAPAAGRVEQLVPAPARRQYARQRPV